MSGITPLPTPPSTSDPSNFSTRADDFLAALPTFATEANDLAAALNNISTTSTSVTSNTIGTGSKAFTVEAGKSYFPGQSVTIAHTGAPTNRMFAVVDSYDSGTGALVVTSQAFEGSGTFTDWTITLGFNGIVSNAQLADDAFITIIGASKNLIITNNSGTPNSQVDIDADEIILKDSSGRAYLAESVNLTANIAASGANGLDTGVEANSTWYYLWVIYNPTTDTVASLISASSTAPTLPSGYTYKALVGAIYNSSGGNFIRILQRGRRVSTAATLVTSTVPSTSYVSISLAQFIPPNASFATALVFIYGTASTKIVAYHSPDSSGAVESVLVGRSGSSDGSGGSSFIDIPIQTSQTVYYKRGGTALAAYEFYISGWEF